jgi:hypothetical protein
MHYVLNIPFAEVRRIAGLPEPDNKGDVHTACPVCKGQGQVSLWVSPNDIIRTNLTVSCFCEHPDIIGGMGLDGLPIIQVP